MFYWWIRHIRDDVERTRYVGGTTVSSSYKRLKFNEKPVNNALDIIDGLELVEHDQAHDLTE